MEKLRLACADIRGALCSFPITLSTVYPDAHDWYRRLENGTKDFIFELQKKVYQLLAESGYFMEPATEDDFGFVCVYAGDPAEEVCSYEYEDELALVLRRLSGYSCCDKLNAEQNLVDELSKTMQAFIECLQNQETS